MRRGYNREVYNCVPSDCVEKSRPIPVMCRSDGLDLYEDNNENCDVCGNGRVDQCEEWGWGGGLRRVTEYLPKTTERVI